jgi:protein-L-isoaspartate(D-aspartate) O-methyltransferase
MTSASDPYQAERLSMVERQVAARGVTDPEVLAALRRIPRHEFVPEAARPAAYYDGALSIGRGQTISQPYIVGLMSSLAQPVRGARVLEVGAGSGYQAAVLAEMGAEVWTTEVIPEQAEQARATLVRLGYGTRVHVLFGDGALGHPAAAPFAAILVTCAVPRVPPPLADQLAPGGRLVLPLGEHLGYQTLTVVTRLPDGSLRTRGVSGVVFVPMTGPHGFEEEG